MTSTDFAASSGNGLAGAFRRFRRFDLGDSAAHSVTLLAGAGIFVLVGVLLVELWLNSRLARHQFGWNFLVTSVWDPIAQHFGALPFLYGTLVTSFLALIIAIPLGLGTAIFLVELVPAWLSDWLAFIIDLLAAVPSVVY
ncbi:MAG TPA: phosphate ABC transporter permease subunit PstC, partial [Terriglobia bacterium]|nr:phosphate ABC transporter permease subunit PstC [Terriglobia bacterium]